MICKMIWYIKAPKYLWSASQTSITHCIYFRYLFWSDIGSSVKIERSSLSGTDRRTIIYNGLLQPLSIDVDLKTSSIVWVDAITDTIETANFDGTNRQIIRRVSSSNYFDGFIFHVRLPLAFYLIFKILKIWSEEMTLRPVVRLSHIVHPGIYETLLQYLPLVGTLFTTTERFTVGILGLLSHLLPIWSRKISNWTSAG